MWWGMISCVWGTCPPFQLLSALAQLKVSGGTSCLLLKHLCQAAPPQQLAQSKMPQSTASRRPLLGLGILQRG